MAIRVKVVNPFTIVLRGAGVSVSDLLEAARKLAKRLQTAIARNFQNMRTFGGNLAGNTAAYDLRKIRQGLSPLRGHATGRLQKAIENVRCWQVRKNGESAVITFSDAPLQGAVHYAEFYAEDKVRFGRIMGVKADWQGDAQKFVDSLGVKGQAQSRRPNPRRRANQLIQAAIAATRRERRTTVEVT